ncbi:ATP-binding protein [Candidatus Woesearchaeota archaeon]|nr:ATP-binding protein [Candidatus Woesearchaeota archaeon]
MEKAQIIGGRFGEILIRQKSDKEIEIGELLISDNKNQTKTLYQIYDMFFSSQISQQNLERISGMELEENIQSKFFNKNTRNYKLALCKALVNIINEKAEPTKNLPEIFNKLREPTEQDLKFLANKENTLFIGNLRSGTKKLPIHINLNAEKTLSHHILITGTTGRGKSVLMKNLLWSNIPNEKTAQLIFDPHDEYYGRNNIGLKDHPEKDKIKYYTPKETSQGQKTLRLNIKKIKPHHLDIIELTNPQKQIMYIYYKKFKENWIEQIITSDITQETQNKEINELSLAVLRRKIKIILDLDSQQQKLTETGIFSKEAGQITTTEIQKELEQGKTVIIDTSNFSGQKELLIANIITTEILEKYQYYNTKGQLNEKPTITIVLEEAPRVIGKEALEKGPNIFSTIAREGRKFKIGLCALTQLPSLIPKEILANMNTKIILGTEMNTERTAIIESASQDLTKDNRNIASLDQGEALITSTFTKFALPINIPFFDKRAKTEIQKQKETKSETKINMIGLK